MKTIFLAVSLITLNATVFAQSSQPPSLSTLNSRGARIGACQSIAGQTMGRSDLAYSPQEIMNLHNFMGKLRTPGGSESQDKIVAFTAFQNKISPAPVSVINKYLAQCFSWAEN